MIIRGNQRGIKQDRAQGARHHGADLGHGIARSCGQVLVTLHLDQPGTQHHGLQFIGGEHQRRQVEAFSQHVADARFAAHRNAVGHQRGDVAVNRARGDFQFLGNLACRHRPAGAAQDLDDLHQSIGSSHGRTIAQAS